MQDTLEIVDKIPMSQFLSQGYVKTLIIFGVIALIIVVVVPLVNTERLRRWLESLLVVSFVISYIYLVFLFFSSIFFINAERVDIANEENTQKIWDTYGLTTGDTMEIVGLREAGGLGEYDSGYLERTDQNLDKVQILRNGNTIKIKVQISGDPALETLTY